MRGWSPWILLVLLCSLVSRARADVEGFGSSASGGADQSVCVVEKSLDECFQHEGRVSDRTIVFSRPSVMGPPGFRYIGDNVTLDGCANGQNGVTIRQPPSAKRGIIVEGPASNVVIRCLRFEGQPGGKRSPDDAEADLLALDGEEGLVTRVLVDRVTVVGATDGALDITGDVSDVTVQWSLIYGTPLAQLIKYGSRRRISLHHNVYTGNGERNPQLHGDARDIDFTSNVVVHCVLDHDGAGNRYSPYGLRIDSAEATIAANVTDNYLGCPSEILGPTDQIHASGNVGVGAFTGGLPGPHPVPESATVTATPASELASILDEVGSPNRTAEDRARLEAVAVTLAAARASQSAAR